MDDEIWILLVVPILALVAIADSVATCSQRLAQRIGPVAAVGAHLAILVLALLVIVFLLSIGLEDPQSAFWIKDYSTAETQIFKIEMQNALFVVDAALVVVSIAAAVVLSVRKRLNIFLCVCAALLGSAGSVIWMIRFRTSGEPRVGAA